MHFLQDPLPAALMAVYGAIIDPEESEENILVITKSMMKAMTHEKCITKYGESPLLTEKNLGTMELT